MSCILLQLFLGCLLFVSTEAAAIHPPIGATYSHSLRLPVIGKQSVTLKIKSRSLAQLCLVGRLNIDDEITYNVDTEGKFTFELSEGTKRLLRRFRTSICGAGYESTTDKAYVEVWPPLPLSIRINLQRLIDESAAETRERFGWFSRGGALA